MNPPQLSQAELAAIKQYKFDLYYVNHRSLIDGAASAAIQGLQVIRSTRPVGDAAVSSLAVLIQNHIPFENHMLKRLPYVPHQNYGNWAEIVATYVVHTFH